ncbi:hypothetical protein CBR_g54349 [Chara braunii]|uniref:Uncharacterized protein n=1 Tax=Chara braunii TaxID=69332 RepID=A0A388MBZ8_CHABU|nr:hypothetical protein CBR_g54349 [Chara braunii]|eukprot:GBG92094.1 hypothetical protein CBR_g54349 [Chara braunii]
MDTDVFVWIESGFDDQQECAIVKAELSGLQRQVGALEERLARLEEARRGKRKVSEGFPSEPDDQGERGVEGDGQESPLSIGAPKRRADARASDEDEGFIEIKEERGANMALHVIAPDPERGLVNLEASSAAGRGRQKSGWWSEQWVTVVCDHWRGTGLIPQGSKEKGVMGRKGEIESPKPTKAQREARGWAQGGQDTGEGQCSQQEVVTPLGMGGGTAQRGPSVAEQTLYRRLMPYDQIGIGSAIVIDFFRGYHVSDFLDKFEQIASHYKWNEVQMLEEVMGFIHIELRDEVDRVVKRARSSWGKFCDDMRHKYWLGEEHPTNNDPEMVPRPLVAQAQQGRQLQLSSQQVLQGGRANTKGQRRTVGRVRGDGRRGNTGRRDGGCGNTGHGNGGRSNEGRGNDRQGAEGRGGSQQNHKWGSKKKGA